MSAFQVLGEVWSNLMHRTRVRRVIFSLLTLIIWCCIVIPIIVTTLNDINTEKSQVLYPSNINNERDLANSLYIYLYFQSVDTFKRTATVFIQLIPLIGLVDSRFRLTQDINCNFRYSQLNIKKGGSASAVSFEVPITEGTTDIYPFEKLHLNFPIYCDDGKGESYELIIHSEKVLQTYTRTTKALQMNELNSNQKLSVFRQVPNEKAIILFTELTQPPRTIFYVFIVALIMWGLTLGLLNVCINVLNDKRDPLTILTFGTAILFALPTLRGTQPGVPGFGCLSDILSFLWCIILTGIFTVANISAQAFT